MDEEFNISDEEAAKLAEEDEGGNGLPPDPDAEGLIPIVPAERFEDGE